MNQSTAFRYQLTQHKKSIILFYLILFWGILSIYLGMIVAFSQDGVSGSGQISGYEISSAIFLFVAGLNSFKDNFGMLLQNGVSRKTILKSRILVTITIGCIMSVIDNIFMVILKYIPRYGVNLDTVSLYEQVYGQRDTNLSAWQMHLKCYIFTVLMYITFMAIGYLITLLFYRMDKRGKIAVGAGVPVVLFLILPNIDFMFFQGRITSTISNFIDLAFGLKNHNSIYAMISFSSLFILFSAFSWVLLKKAMVKKV
ncbi:MAG: hypothetical protein ACERKZ_17645 [Lachnotalea sp.]